MTTRDRYGMFAETTQPFGEALEALRASLKDEGFGVLWEIDVKETMRAKLGEAMEDYTILGACNPPLAYRALAAEKEIGLLLPCNCIVRREGERTVLGALEPRALVRLTGRDDLGPFAEEVAERLERALAAAARS